MDTLKLTPKIVHDEKNRVESIFIELRINNVEIASSDDYAVNIQDLFESIQEDGDYDFWTCHCGIPECAFIYDRIKSKKLDNKISWEINDQPFSKKDKFIFDLNDYELEIDRCIEDLKSIIDKPKRSNFEREIYPDPRLTGTITLLEKYR